RFRYGAVTAMSGLVPPLTQSGTVTVNGSDVPSVYRIRPVPLAGPYVAVTSMPNVPPVPVRWNACPAATALSGSPAGQVKDRPRYEIVPPGVTPTLASACAEKLDPEPSMFPAPGFASSVVPTLVNAAASDGAGTLTVDVVRSPPRVPVSSVNTVCQ